MNDAAGLNDSSVFDVVMGIVYAISALFLIVTAFILITKKFRRNKIEAINQLEFVTSRYNIYDGNTQFLFNVPREMHIYLELLNEKEELVSVLTDQNYKVGEHIYHFDISPYPTGLYYLKLKAENCDMLRKIRINK
ncbi:MAG: hypothetical protein ACWA41_01715 [Putridiphycobacter sp.]